MNPESRARSSEYDEMAALPVGAVQLTVMLEEVFAGYVGAAGGGSATVVPVPVLDQSDVPPVPVALTRIQ